MVSQVWCPVRLLYLGKTLVANIYFNLTSMNMDNVGYPSMSIFMSNTNTKKCWKKNSDIFISYPLLKYGYISIDVSADKNTWSFISLLSIFHPILERGIVSPFSSLRPWSVVTSNSNSSWSYYKSPSQHWPSSIRLRQVMTGLENGNNQSAQRCADPERWRANASHMWSPSKKCISSFPQKYY